MAVPSPSVAEICKRDLSQSSRVTEHGMTESRSAHSLQAGESISIEDITSSKIQIIDNLEKLTQIVTELNPVGKESLPFLTKWHKLKFEKKLKLYS